MAVMVGHGNFLRLGVKESGRISGDRISGQDFRGQCASIVTADIPVKHEGWTRAVSWRPSVGHLHSDFQLNLVVVDPRYDPFPSFAGSAHADQTNAF